MMNEQKIATLYAKFQMNLHPDRKPNMFFFVFFNFVNDNLCENVFFKLLKF